MGTYFIVRCFIKTVREKTWAEYEYGPYLNLTEAIEMMVDHVEAISMLRYKKGKVVFKAEIDEVIMSEIGSWEPLRKRIEQTERVVDNA